MNEPFDLSTDECRELLSAGLVGRVAICTPVGPHIVPVNYGVVDDERRAPDVAVQRPGQPCARIHPGPRGRPVRLRAAARLERRGAWPGRGGHRCRGAEPHQDRVGAPNAWAAGQRNLYLRIRWSELTGRRLGAGWNPADELPVRRVDLNEEE